MGGFFIRKFFEAPYGSETVQRLACGAGRSNGSKNCTPPRDTKRQIRETPSAGTHLKNPASCPIFCV